jgi:hypothetical protein
VANADEKFIEIPSHNICVGFGDEVPRATDQLERRSGNKVGCFTHQIGWRRFIAITAQTKRRQTQTGRGRVKIAACNRFAGGRVAFGIGVDKPRAGEGVFVFGVPPRQCFINKGCHTFGARGDGAGVPRVGLTELVGGGAQTIPRTRSRRFTARPWAIMPPIDRPKTTASRTP